MVSYQQALDLIRECFASLYASEIIKEKVEVDLNTVVLGEGSILGSLGFVYFISDLEERLSEVNGSEIFLVINELQEFNADNPTLKVDAVARYAEKITAAAENIE